MTKDTQPEALRLAEWIEGDMTCDGDAEIASELRRLHAENEALRKDAERYRWLKQRPLDWSIEYYRNGWATTYGRNELDAAIDAAMQSTK